MSRYMVNKFLCEVESDDVDLASFKGRKPVVLFFGSYT